jgi:hypothetical protein
MTTPKKTSPPANLKHETSLLLAKLSLDTLFETAFPGTSRPKVTHFDSGRTVVDAAFFKRLLTRKLVSATKLLDTPHLPRRLVLEVVRAINRLIAVPRTSKKTHTPGPPSKRPPPPPRHSLPPRHGLGSRPTYANVVACPPATPPFISRLLPRSQDAHKETSSVSATPTRHQSPTPTRHNPTTQATPTTDSLLAQKAASGLADRFVSSTILAPPTAPAAKPKSEPAPRFFPNPISFKTAYPQDVNRPFVNVACSEFNCLAHPIPSTPLLPKGIDTHHYNYCLRLYRSQIAALSTELKIISTVAPGQPLPPLPYLAAYLKDELELPVSLDATLDPSAIRDSHLYTTFIPHDNMRVILWRTVCSLIAPQTPCHQSGRLRVHPAHLQIVYHTVNSLLEYLDAHTSVALASLSPDADTSSEEEL